MHEDYPVYMKQLTELMFSVAKEADQLSNDKTQKEKSQIKHRMAEILGTELLLQHELSKLTTEEDSHLEENKQSHETLTVFSFFTGHNPPIKRL